MYTVATTRSAVRHGLRAIVASPSVAGRHNSTSTMHENDPELLEKEKQRNLSHSQHKTSTPHENAPGWNEYLATASEANVKADRGAPVDPKNLQAETIKYIKARHFDTEGTEANTTAYYTHDIVTGPLSAAEGKEEVLVHEGQVRVNEQIPDPQAEKLERRMKPTDSEEQVKADRGDI